MSTSKVPQLSCSVSWCTEPSYPEMILFNLPQDEQEKQNWIEILNINPPIPNKYFVCSNHFNEDAFVSDSPFPKLKPNAVPNRDYLVPSIGIHPVDDLNQSGSVDDEILCRACMAECKDLNKSLSVAGNLSLFENSTGIKLIMAKSLPNTICVECYEIIINWERFKQQCASSNEIFTNELGTENLPNDQNDAGSNKRKQDDLMMTGGGNKRQKMATNEVADVEESSSDSHKDFNDEGNSLEDDAPQISNSTDFQNIVIDALSDVIKKNHSDLKRHIVTQINQLSSQYNESGSNANKNIVNQNKVSSVFSHKFYKKSDPQLQPKQNSSSKSQLESFTTLVSHGEPATSNIDSNGDMESVKEGNHLNAIPNNFRIKEKEDWMASQDERNGEWPITNTGSNYATPLKSQVPWEPSHQSEDGDNNTTPEPVAQKRYSCSSCSYSTDRRDVFTRHETIHKTEKPFHCYACEKQFNRSDHVKKHFLRMHPDVHCDVNRTRRVPLAYPRTNTFYPPGQQMPGDGTMLEGGGGYQNSIKKEDDSQSMEYDSLDNLAGFICNKLQDNISNTSMQSDADNI